MNLMSLVIYFVGVSLGGVLGYLFGFRRGYQKALDRFTIKTMISGVIHRDVQ